MLEPLSEKELSLGEILSLAFTLFKEQLGTIVKVVAIITIPLYLLTYIIYANTWNPYHLNYISLLIKILVMLLLILIDFAVIHITTESVTGNTINYKQAINKGFAPLFISILTIITTTIIVLGGFLLLIIPGIYLTVRYTFVLHAVVLKNLQHSEARQYSKRLVDGRWWKVLGYSLVIYTIVILASFILNLTYNLVPLNFIFFVVFRIIRDTITSFSIIALTIFFLNLDFTTTPQIVESPQITKSSDYNTL